MGRICQQPRSFGQSIHHVTLEQASLLLLPTPLPLLSPPSCMYTLPLTAVFPAKIGVLGYGCPGLARHAG